MLVPETAAASAAVKPLQGEIRVETQQRFSDLKILKACILVSAEDMRQHRIGKSVKCLCFPVIGVFM